MTGPVVGRDISIEAYLARVGGEVCRAAALLAAARSMRFVPQYEERLAESAVRTGAMFMQEAIHMAGLVSLCAVLEQSRRRDLINLKALLRRLADTEVRRLLAARRDVDDRLIFDQIERIN